MTQPPYGQQPQYGEQPRYGEQPGWDKQQPGPGTPYGAPTPPPYGYPMVRQTNGKAIGAIVCGIASLVTCLLFLGIPAVVLGNLALGEIDDARGIQDGRQLAVAGRLLGWVAIALMILGLLALLVVLLFAAASTP
ncbi:MAG: DUF4190 domain-containing protein [Williamsia herbipolensis]|nr:DUF4190 domain-containing protein [Williamsia herbipolensis]